MNFLYSISIRKRMSLILLAFMLPIMVLTYQLNGKLHENITFAEMEIHGTTYIKPLLTLLNEVADFQITALLAKNGDDDAATEAPKTLLAIDKDMADLIAIDKKIGLQLGVTTTTEFSPTVLQQKWQAIKASQLDPAAYDAFLKDTLSLIAYIADKSNLILDPELDTYYMMDAATTGLPTMLGELAKIKYLIYRQLQGNNNQLTAHDKPLTLLEFGLIENVYLPKVTNSIKTAMENDAANNGISQSLTATMNEKLATYISSTKELNKTVESLLNGTSISPAEYIEIADKSHDGSAILAQATLDELVKMLNIRIKNLTHVLHISMGSCFLALLCAFGLFFIISGSIVSPISRLQEVMEGMLEGRLEVTVPGQNYKDETGAMAKCVESFRLSGLEKIKLASENIANEKRAKEDKTRAMRELANSFENRMQSIIQTVAAAATELYHTAESMSKLMENAGQKVSSVKGTSEKTSHNVNTVASAAEEMAASIKEVALQVVKSSGAVKSSADEVEKTDKTSGLLQDSAQKIGNVVELIQDISEQINLLALNATIEAARAGDAGKGFAVVASEVKNLAGQTTKATEEIAQYVSNIQSVSGNVLGGLQSIKKSMLDVEQYSGAISAAVEEQRAATSEIASSMSTAASGSAQITRDIADINQTSTEAGISADQVLQAARMLSVESEKLNSEVAKFIGELRNG